MISRDVVEQLINEFKLRETRPSESNSVSQILGMDVFEVSNRTNFVRIQ